MTLEEVYKILYKKYDIVRFDYSDNTIKAKSYITIDTFDLFELINGLKETYAPKIKMTTQEFERFGKRFASSGMSGFKIELDKNGEEHSLYTKTELLAWLHPELIEVSDD